jgi:hypothetical protein
VVLKIVQEAGWRTLEKIDQYQRSTEKKDEKLTEILMRLPEQYFLE